MAKGIEDKTADTPVEATPATGGEIRSLMGRYENLQEEKSGIGSIQTNMLKEFDANHGLPPFVFKFLRKIEGIEDLGSRTHAWNTLVRAGKELGFDQQPDMFDGDGPANDVEPRKRARATA